MKRCGAEPATRIDGDEARNRLAGSYASEASRHHESERVLAERALRLAASSEATATAGVMFEVITFRAGDRRYAIESRCVLEVAHCGPLSRVPGGRPVLRGISQLRGDLLPVFALSILGGGLGADVVPQGQLLLVLGTSLPDLGFLVDAVEQVTALSSRTLGNPQSLGAIPYPEFVRAVTADGCLLLDADAILQDRHVFVARPSNPESAGQHQ